jgi:hypothetical protein
MPPDEAHPFPELTPEEEETTDARSACSCLYLWAGIIYAGVVGLTLLGENLAGRDRIAVGVGAVVALSIITVINVAVYRALRARGDSRGLHEPPPLDLILADDAESPGAGMPDAQSLGTCPYCQSRIPLRAARIICPACKTPHHRECWRENGGCTTYGCVESPHG